MAVLLLFYWLVIIPRRVPYLLIGQLLALLQPLVLRGSMRPVLGNAAHLRLRMLAALSFKMTALDSRIFLLILMGLGGSTLLLVITVVFTLISQ